MLGMPGNVRPTHKNYLHIFYEKTFQHTDYLFNTSYYRYFIRQRTYICPNRWSIELWSRGRKPEPNHKGCESFQTAAVKTDKGHHPADKHIRQSRQHPENCAQYATVHKTATA